MLNDKTPDPKALALLRESGMGATGFGEREFEAIRPKSALWSEIEEKQNEIWGIGEQTETMKQRWRDICASLVYLVEQAVEPLADRKSRPNITDRDTKPRVLRHRDTYELGDRDVLVPSVTVESARIQFVDLLTVRLVPQTFGRFMLRVQHPSGGKEVSVTSIVFREDDGAFYVNPLGQVTHPADEKFTDEKFAELCVLGLHLLYGAEGSHVE